MLLFPAIAPFAAVIAMVAVWSQPRQNAALPDKQLAAMLLEQGETLSQAWIWYQRLQGGRPAERLSDLVGDDLLDSLPTPPDAVHGGSWVLHREMVGHHDTVLVWLPISHQGVCASINQLARVLPMEIPRPFNEDAPFIQGVWQNLVGCLTFTGGAEPDYVVVYRLQ